MDLDLLWQWLNREPVQIQGRTCIFPHGADFIRAMVAQHREKVHFEALTEAETAMRTKPKTPVKHVSRKTLR